MSNINKTEAKKQLDKLEKEVEKLRDIINKPEDLKDKIKTYSDVCEELGIEELTIKDFSFLPKDERKRALAFHKLTNITKLFNQDWYPNWDNHNEYKYYPWFEGSGFGGLVFYCVYCYCTFVRYAGCLYHKNRENAEYCAKQFSSIYIEYLS